VQWETILRSVAGMRAYRWLTKGESSPMGIADFLIFDGRMPRSLSFCDDEDRDQPDLPGKGLWHPRHPCHDHIDVLTSRLDTMTIERVFEDGLHEFITDFPDRHRAARRTDRKGLPIPRLATRCT
jgi:uncharacterized alpha-E superfamily protein